MLLVLFLQYGLERGLVWEYERGTISRKIEQDRQYIQDNTISFGSFLLQYSYFSFILDHALLEVTYI